MFLVETQILPNINGKYSAYMNVEKNSKTQSLKRFPEEQKLINLLKIRFNLKLNLETTFQQKTIDNLSRNKILEKGVHARVLNARNSIGSFNKATNHFDIKVEFLVTFIENWNCLLTYFYSFSYHLNNKSFTQEQCQADAFKKRKLIGEKYFTRNISLKFIYTTMQCIKIMQPSWQLHVQSLQQKHYNKV